MQVWGNCSTSTTLLSAHSDAKMPTFYDLWADVLDTFIRISEFFFVTVMLIQVGTFETVPCRHCPHQEDFSFYRASIYSFCLFLVSLISKLQDFDILRTEPATQKFSSLHHAFWWARQVSSFVLGFSLHLIFHISGKIFKKFSTENFIL